ncbi:MAG TPA: hypothetical protein VLA48_04205 [Nitrososphaeraceae archaeon]|nr:hypothetical protein [Nitrososphaeraceae archaeon]
MIKNWDEEEAAKDAKTYQTKEGGLRALDYMIKKYMGTREDKKINPTKQTAEEVLDLFTNTLLFDEEFHQFALDNYRVLIEYDKNENILDIIKMKDHVD